MGSELAILSLRLPPSAGWMAGPWPLASEGRRWTSELVPGTMERVRAWGRTFKQRGYLGGVVPGLCVAWLARSLPMPVSLLLGLVAGFALFRLLRWEAQSEANRERSMRLRAVTFGWGFSALGVPAV